MLELAADGVTLLQPKSHFSCTPLHPRWLVPTKHPTKYKLHPPPPPKQNTSAPCPKGCCQLRGGPTGCLSLQLRMLPSCLQTTAQPHPHASLSGASHHSKSSQQVPPALRKQKCCPGSKDCCCLRGTSLICVSLVQLKAFARLVQTTSLQLQPHAALSGVAHHRTSRTAPPPPHTHTNPHVPRLDTSCVATQWVA